MTLHHLRIALAIALIGAIAAGKQTFAAPPSTLDLSGFEGEVLLVQGTDTRLRQPRHGWQLVEERGSLMLREQTPAANDPFVCEQRPWASSPARAAVIAGSGKGVRVEIDVAPTTTVRARHFSGTLRSSMPLHAPQLEVEAGAIELARVDGGRLAVVGAGSMAIGHAAGKLDVAVNGGGTLRINGGVTDELNAALHGSGSIRHDGVVRRATLSASGDGTIRLRRVEDPVRVEQSGFASIDIRCAESGCVR